jgi:hypothetical protein
LKPITKTSQDKKTQNKRSYCFAASNNRLKDIFCCIKTFDKKQPKATTKGKKKVKPGKALNK